MIKVKNITKKYGKRIILDNLSLNINDGEAIGLLGSNGSGKTTLLEIIIGQIKPNHGEVFVDGRKDGYKEMGIQFQEGFWPKGVNSKLIINYFKKNRKALKDPEVIKLINIFEIEDFIEKDLNDLSGGEKQRLNTLLAVINNPKYICLDEMITGLDLKMQFKLINFFQECKNEGKTIIVISHIPEEVEKLCNRFIILQNGKIYYESTVEESIKEFGTMRNLMFSYYEGKLKTNVK